MFVNPQLYLLILVLALAFYWAVPREHTTTRAIVILISSMSVIASISIVALLLCLLSSGLSAYASRLFVHKPNIRILLAVVCLQIAIMISPVYLGFPGSPAGTIVSVGIAYFTLKSISTVVDAYKFQKHYALLDVLVLNLFFPIYSAGPIEQIRTLSSDKFNVKFDIESFVQGGLRIFVGIFKYYYISQSLIAQHTQTHFLQHAATDWLTPVEAYVLIALKWLMLYLYFSGYTDIAIGTSRLFNIHVRENFNFPYIAGNIQNYWQRWHMSLMNFMSEYVYIAFVRRTGMRILGIGLVFLAAGTWHHISLNYLIWGCLHASAMMTYLVYRRRISSYPRFEVVGHHLIYRIGCWWITMSFVFLVSAIGTSATTAEAMWIVRSLFYLH